MSTRSRNYRRAAKPDLIGRTMLYGKGSLSMIAAVSLSLWLRALVITLAVLWIFSPAFHGDWLIDDDLYLFHNSLLRDPDRLWKAWFLPGSFVEYYPLEESVQWIQWNLWGEHKLGYHLTNVFLHILNALLVWRLFSKFKLPLAWVGGLIFAVHPVTVESVAWISELKNTLSLVPFLFSICAYIDYVETRRSRDYFLSLGCFLLAMLCKVSMSPFPVVILLYVWWKHGRIGWNDLKASAPFFLISLVLGALTILSGAWYDHTLRSHPLDLPLEGFGSRIALAGLSLSFYFSKCVLPLGMSFTYPQWNISPPALEEFLPLPILAAALGWFWSKRQSWGRHALLGVGFFIIFLLPFLGLFGASYMSFTWVMDHFTYIPVIGLIGLGTAGLGDLEQRLLPSVRPFAMAFAGVVLGLLAVESHSYASTFVSEDALWRNTVRLNPHSWIGLNNLACSLVTENRLSEAKPCLESAIANNPTHPSPHKNMGNYFYKNHQLPEAVDQYKQALKLDPNFAMAHNDLGEAYLKLGRLDDALSELNRVLKLDPDYPYEHCNIGNVLLQMGRIEDAIKEFRVSLKRNPGHAETHYSVGKVMLRSGKPDVALHEFQRAILLNPSYAEAHYEYGNLLVQTGHLSEGMEQFRQAIQADPQYTSARLNLGTALIQSGDPAGALEQYQEAALLSPDAPTIHANMGTALAQLGRLSEGKAEYERALQLDPANTEARDNLKRLLDLQRTHLP